MAGWSRGILNKIEIVEKAEIKKQLDDRFKVLLAEAKQKWGDKHGLLTQVGKAMDALPASVSIWQKEGFKGSKLQLDALSRELSGLVYPQKAETILTQGDGEDRADRKSRRYSILDKGAAAGAKEAWEQILKMVTAPIIAYAQGGEGAYPVDQGADVPRIAVPCRDPNCYVLELEGDSMEPIFREGDLLVIAPNLEPRNNDMVIVRTVEDEVLFKQYKHPKPNQGDTFQFLSLNPNHAPLYLRPDQIFKVSVVHSVIKPLREKVRAMTVR